MSGALLLWLACTGPELADPGPAPDTEVQASLSSRSVGSGEQATLQLRVTTGEGWGFAADGPEAEGLDVEPLAAQTLGPPERETAVLGYALSGPDGSYVIPALEVRFTGPSGEEQAEQVGPFYLDIGVDGPSSQLAELAGLQPSETPRWPWAAGALAALAVLGAAGVIWRRGQRQEVEDLEPPTPPDVLALEAWAAARADTTLDEHGLALALSKIFRRYLEDVLELPATSMTSFELLDELREVSAFTAALHERSKRLLSATDLIKFARQGGGDALFEELDADLRAVVGATAPKPAAEPADA